MVGRRAVASNACSAWVPAFAGMTVLNAAQRKAPALIDTLKAVIPAQAGTHNPSNEAANKTNPAPYFKYRSNHPIIRFRKSF